MNTKLLFLLCATLPLPGFAQIDYDGGVYTQDFDTLSNGTIYTPYSTVSGILWAPNQDLWIRWSGAPHSFFAAHAMAIDDLSFRAVPELRILPNGPEQYSSCDLQSAPAPPPRIGMR